MSRLAQSKKTIGRAALAVSFVGALIGGVAGATPALAAPVPAASGPCAANNFCLYTGQNQTGSKCSWSQSTSNTSAAPACSWLAAGTPALSDANNTSGLVTMWVGPGWSEGGSQRIGSSAAGGRGNFTIPWHIGSLLFS